MYYYFVRIGEKKIGFRLFFSFRSNVIIHTEESEPETYRIKRVTPLSWKKKKQKQIKKKII